MKLISQPLTQTPNTKHQTLNSSIFNILSKGGGMTVRLPKFEYFEPKDIREAVSILQNEPKARILAGGTDLLPNMKHRVECPPVVVNIKRIADLNYIRQDDGDIRIGALVPLKRLYMAAPVKDNVPGLAQAASCVGSYHLWHSGISGGIQ